MHRIMILPDTRWVYGRISRYIFCWILYGYTAGYPATYFAGYQMGIRPDIPLPVPILPDTRWPWVSGRISRYLFCRIPYGYNIRPDIPLHIFLLIKFCVCQKYNFSLNNFSLFITRQTFQIGTTNSREKQARKSRSTRFWTIIELSCNKSNGNLLSRYQILKSRKDNRLESLRCCQIHIGHGFPNSINNQLEMMDA